MPVQNCIKKYPFLIFLIVVVTMTTYSFMLSGDFKTMDDQATIVDNKDLHSFSNAGKVFQDSFFGGNSYYRPLVVLSNMANYRFRGPYPLIFNLTNLLLHIITALSVFWLVNILTEDRHISFLSALLFAIHPVQWSAVCLIAGRAIILCTLFCILAAIFFCLFDKKKKAGFYFLSLSAFVLALLSKESAVVFPGIVFFYLALFTKGGWAQRIKNMMYIVPFAVIDGAYLILRKSLGIINVGSWETWQQLVLGVTTFLRSVFMYVRILVFPVDLHFDRSSRYLTSFVEPEFIITIGTFVIVSAAFFVLRKKISAQGRFFVAWVAVSLITVSQAVPIIAGAGYAITAEHFLYMPSAGIFALFVLGGRALFKKAARTRAVSPAIMKLGAAGFYVFLILMTVQYNIYSGNEIAMFQQSLKFNPSNARVRTSLALALAKERRFKESKEEFERALEYDPYDARTRIGLGKILFDMGYYFEGIAEYEKVANAGGMSPLLKNNLDLSYAFLINKYQAKVAEAPNDPLAYFSLGVIYSRSGKIQKAINQYHKSIALDPYFKEALFNLASSYASLKEQGLAIEYFQQIINLPAEPNYLDYHSYVYLSKLYAQLGAPEKAREYQGLADEMPPELREFGQSYIAKTGEE